MGASDWELVLDGLEHDLDAVENGVEAAYVDWAPPTGLGPVPPDLQARARTVRDRQLQALATLRPQVAAARYQLDAGRRAARRPSARLAASVYLDTTA